MPRRLYGAYIQDLLGNEIWQTGNGRNLYRVPDEAVALWQRPDGFSVQVRSGRTYEVDVAVLATATSRMTIRPPTTTPTRGRRTRWPGSSRTRRCC